MKYRIDPDAPESAYLQLYRQLRQDLVSGELPFGTRLPSKRLLAGELGVSLVTVEHAYALLCDEGYVEARERSGYFASFGGRLRREAPLPPLPAAESLEAPPEDFPFSVLACAPPSRPTSRAPAASRSRRSASSWAQARNTCIR